MTLIARWLTALAVVLGLTLVAISTYAAKIGVMESVAAAYSPDDQQRSVSRVEGGEGSAVDSNVERGAQPAATATRQVTPAPTPTAVPRYPAPAEAAAVVPAPRSRNNLSVGARVWPVLSLKPSPASVPRLGDGGLEILPEQLAVMQQVSRETGIPWQIFGAIAKVESDLGRNMATSSAGAIGYGQFLPEMWEVYGEGGDPYDFHDVIPAMGRYLLVAGAPADISGALHAYNHSWPYVAQVLSYASAYGDAATATAPASGQRERLIWPVVGPISSYFGPGHPLGIDVDQTMVPGASVRAAHDGVVLFAGGDPCCSYGRYAILVAPSGITTLYGHFDAVAVEPGQTVSKGEPLGTVGSTGYSTGTHLHFEVIEDGARRDPLEYLP